MTGLVHFDQKGPFGPAMTLIYQAQYYNELGIKELANLLKANFMKLASVRPKGKKEFCAFVLEKNQSQSTITPAEIIGTKFFQSMQKKEPVHQHDKVLNFIVPHMLKTVQEQLPESYVESDIVNEWTSRFVESYITEEQIRNHSDLQAGVREKIMEERKAIGAELYKAATTKKLTEKDLDSLIDMSRIVMERLQKADHFASTLSLTGRYLSLFSMNEENPLNLSEEILNLLSTVFREKMFPTI